MGSAARREVSVKEVLWLYESSFPNFSSECHYLLQQERIGTVGACSP